jgi:FkbM family methyltransferase
MMASRFKRRVMEVTFRFGTKTIGRFQFSHTWWPSAGIYSSLVRRLSLPGAVIQVGGNTLYLDPLDPLQLGARGEHDPMETSVYSEQVKPGQVVLDIGANIGYFTLQFASLVGPQGRVYAFEPMPTNFDLLSKNIRANEYSNIVAVRTAVGGRPGKGRLYLSQDSSGDHRVQTPNEPRASIPIDITSVDAFLESHPTMVDFVKMDIQGSEGAALLGMRRTISENPTMKMLVEFCPPPLREAGIDPRTFLSDLSKGGFVLYHVDERKRTVKPANEVELLTRYDTGPEGSTNILCIPLKRSGD